MLGALVIGLLLMPSAGFAPASSLPAITSVVSTSVVRSLDPTPEPTGPATVEPSPEPSPPSGSSTVIVLSEDQAQDLWTGALAFGLLGAVQLLMLTVIAVRLLTR